MVWFIPKSIIPVYSYPLQTIFELCYFCSIICIDHFGNYSANYLILSHCQTSSPGQSKLLLIYIYIYIYTVRGTAMLQSRF